VSAIAREHVQARRSPTWRIAATLGIVGATLGLVAGVVELTAGPSIRSWVGNKEDTTRLGLATLVLAAIALAAALALARRLDASAPRRLVFAAALLLPGLICFTTVGRLWYLPGALLIAAGVTVADDLRGEAREVAAAATRNGTAILTVVLACFYVFLGATALGVAGVLGILGGLLILGLVAMRGKLPMPVTVVLLLLATLPFAVLTWWSVATPLIGILLLALGMLALSRSRERPHRPRRAGTARVLR
jgi:MFS family permease